MLLFLDSCVILSRLPRELLLAGAKQGAFELSYSDSVEAESRHVAKRNAIESDIAAAFVDLRLHATRIENAKEIDGFWLPDDNDRHVALGAIEAGADVIATENLRDFPKSALAPYGLLALNPDQILVAAMNEQRFTPPDDLNLKELKNAKLYRFAKQIDQR